MPVSRLLNSRYRLRISSPCSRRYPSLSKSFSMWGTTVCEISSLVAIARAASCVDDEGQVTVFTDWRLPTAAGRRIFRSVICAASNVRWLSPEAQCEKKCGESDGEDACYQWRKSRATAEALSIYSVTVIGWSSPSSISTSCARGFTLLWSWLFADTLSGELLLLLLHSALLSPMRDIEKVISWTICQEDRGDTRSTASTGTTTDDANWLTTMSAVAVGRIQ